VKDYYRVLGVLDDAEDIIIRAAYKALAQRYHPDKWKGDPQEANKRMSDINEAYGILSDPIKRKKYDEEYFRNRPREESAEDENDDESNFISEEDEAWKMALEFFPEIKEEYIELSKISNILANTFRAILIEGQEFNQSRKIRKRLESDYMNRYYGSDETIKNFAKTLLLNNERKAAIKVNKIVRFMGKSVNAMQLIDQVEKEFKHLKKYSFLNIESLHSKLIKKSITKEEIFKLINFLFPSSSGIDYSYSMLTGDSLYKFMLDGKRHSYYYDEIINLLLKKIET